jgi:hypothetical protein
MHCSHIEPYLTPETERSKGNFLAAFFLFDPIAGPEASFHFCLVKNLEESAIRRNFFTASEDHSIIITH